MEDEALKTIEIEGETYNISAYSAATGSWLLMQLMRAFREYIATLDHSKEETAAVETEEPVDFANELIQMLLMNFSEADFTTIQRHALKVITCTTMLGEKTFEQPIIRPNGTFLIKALATNVSVVMSLTSQSLFANLAPFFTKTGLKAVMKGEQVSSR